MGVSLSTLVKGREIDFPSLKGRTIAIDAYNTLYQFLSIIRDRFTGEPLRDSQGRITSHLSGLFYRGSKMVEEGIIPIFVFDGEPPAFKQSALEGRARTKIAAEAKLKEALERGETEKVRVYAQATSRLTKDMVEEAKALLGYMGISWIQAPSEGEAQAAHLLKRGQAWAVGSQDWDSLLFGAERMVRNLTLSGRRKVAGKEAYRDVAPELVELDAVLKELGISHDQLIMLGILVGTDYNPGGVKGVGPKTALKLVKEHKTPGKILSAVQWDSPVPFQEIAGFFHHPPVEDLPVPKHSLQKDKLLNFLAREHSFSPERIQPYLARLEKSQEQQKQQGLGGFFGKRGFIPKHSLNEA